METVKKPEAAKRQLDVAIRILLEGKDPLAVRTLVGASNEVLADLVEKGSPGESWRSKLIETTGLDRGAAVKLLNETQNYLKHADRDPDAELQFDREESDHAIFMATLECGALGVGLSAPMQVYQLWYIAMYPDRFPNALDLQRAAAVAFPNFGDMPREERLRTGLRYLQLFESKAGAST